MGWIANVFGAKKLPLLNLKRQLVLKFNRVDVNFFADSTLLRSLLHRNDKNGELLALGN